MYVLTIGSTEPGCDNPTLIAASTDAGALMLRAAGALADAVLSADPLRLEWGPGEDPSHDTACWEAWVDVIRARIENVPFIT